MARIPLRRHDGSVRAWTTVDDADFEWLGQWPWHLRRDKYACRNIGHGAGNQRPLYMHQAILGRRFVDHINRKSLDNRRANLCPASPAQNAQNIPVRGSVPYRGVVRTPSGRFRAKGTLSGQPYLLGLYDTPEEAAAVASAWRAENMPFSEDARAAA